MSAEAMPVETILARILDDVGNFSLRLDPLSRARLDALEGTCVQVNILPPGSGEPRTMTILVSGGHLACRAGAGEDPHLVLTGTPPDLIRMLLGRDSTGSVRMEGDESRLEKLADLFRQLDPDPAAPLEGLLGRELADNLVGMAETGMALLRSAAQTVAGGIRTEARSRFVDQQDVEALLKRSEDLRLRVDRLRARTERLAAAAPDAGPDEHAPAPRNTAGS